MVKLFNMVSKIKSLNKFFEETIILIPKVKGEKIRSKNLDR